MGYSSRRELPSVSAYDLLLPLVAADETASQHHFQTHQSELTTKPLYPEGFFSRGGRILNRRPHGPEPCALSGLSHAPIFSRSRLFSQRFGSSAEIGTIMHLGKNADAIIP